ncbi:MAG: two-component sensor histidine kinase [Burkholderiales bacterium]|nr:two-component sensor histidine kinase [Burkholderiales bacterium]
MNAVIRSMTWNTSRWMRGFVARSAFGDSRFALTRWFAAVGALAIGVFSLAMGWLLSSFLEARMLERDAAISRDFVQSIANIQQVVGFFRDPNGAPAPSVTEFFAHVAAMPDVLRANVYAPDRRVLWSSRPELIGKTFPANDELDEALKGRVVVNREVDEQPDTKAEHQGLASPGNQFVENYLPVFDDKSHGLIGVIEVYRQPVALFAAIASGQRLVWLSSAGGGAFLFFALVWFVRRTERALQEQQRRLVDAETLAIVGEISAAVAHSIRNPLASIRTSAELQLEIGGDDSGVFREVVRNIDRIEHLVRTLLTYAADPSDHQASADIGAVLRDAAERFAPDLRTGGRGLELNVANDLGTIGADPVLLAQVFNSLIANAVEAIAAGGHVRVSARREGAQALIEVADSGAGIPAEQLQDIFKPFYTTKPRGLGLGLPLARRIVQRLGGQMQIESLPGRGTTVALRLPFAAPTP